MRTDAWIKSQDLNKKIYEVSACFRKQHFSLYDQLSRAALSIPTNIAEGLGRDHLKERKQFLNISYGSLMEVLSLLYTAYKLGFIDKETFNDFATNCKQVSALINGFKKLYHTDSQ
jgi:four helix bundle protein